MKKKIDVIASEESYQNLSTFHEVEELNETVRTYREVIKSNVKRADVQNRLIALLEVLKRHSCKYIGVSFLRKNTIADMLEVSYKTVQRLVKKLVVLGMVKQVATKRSSDMLQTANAIIIQPAQKEEEKQEVSDKNVQKSPTKCPTNKTNTNSLKQNIIKERKDGQSIDTANFVSHWVPKQFSNFAFSFFGNAKIVEEFYRVVRQCNIVEDHATGSRILSENEEVETATSALKELIMKIKAGKRIKNLFGYFNGIVNNLMDKHHYETVFELYESLD